MRQRAVTIPNERYIDFEKLTHKEGVSKIRLPLIADIYGITMRVHNDSQRIEMESVEYPSLAASGASFAEAVQEFYDVLIHAYTFYTSKKDSELSGDAIELRDYLMKNTQIHPHAN